MGSSSLTRDGTWVPCIGSVESQSLNHQGSSPMECAFIGCHSPCYGLNVCVHLHIPRVELIASTHRWWYDEVRPLGGDEIKRVEPSLMGFVLFRIIAWITLAPWFGSIKRKSQKITYYLTGCVCVCVCVFSRFSRVQLFGIPWTRVHQAPLSVAFSRQEHWSGLPCPTPGDLPNSWIEPEPPVSPALQADTLPLSSWGSSKSV